jgi:formylglycine-generating enzyme required for sulfatase activity
LRVFLSYHTPDRAVALGLKSAIEGALPGADVFVDQTHLRHGHLWQRSLFEAIARAQAFVILVSHGIGDWQKVEYFEAQKRKVKDDAFILLPIIIADRARGLADNLPGLGQIHWIESTEPTAPEPLAKIVAALQAHAVPKSPQLWRTINPYRGLVALNVQDADFFFGREREAGEVLERIIAAPGRLIALVGDSGVGKSSLVQAGVISALKRERWPGGKQAWPQSLEDSRAYAYLRMEPGKNPIEMLVSEFTALWFPDRTDSLRLARDQEWTVRLRQVNPDGSPAARLANLIKATDEHLRDRLSLTPPPRYLLYIDQGEELYSRASPDERRRFSEIIADGLASSAQRLIVMTSQRADYFGKLQGNAALFRLTEVISVPPLDADNLALVLREPARVLGVGFESDDLVRHVVSAAEGQPGALPLLADLFTDLWERMRKRGDGTLRVADAREIIQVGAALLKRADKFLRNNPGKVDAVKRLFTLRLAHVPRQGEPVRARWERDAEPGTDPTADAEWTLAELLAGQDWRLTVTGAKNGKATAEVAHEILLKTWSTLRRWLEVEREFLVWRGELDARRKDYDAAGAMGRRQQRQQLLMGLPLDRARTWLAARTGDIEPEDRAFIAASVKAERAAARTWRAAQAAVGLLLLGIVASLLAFIFQDEIHAHSFVPYVLSTEREHALKPGAFFRECARDCPEMVVVPSGEFRMGSSESEAGRQDTEGPSRTVTIAKPFAVGRHEVTWDDWTACVDKRGCVAKESTDGSFDKGHNVDKGRNPVINISWHEAKMYVAWLSRMTGKSYRLLTEAEWEYAARGVTSVAPPHPPYPWGDTASHEYANYGADQCCSGRIEGWDRWRNTAPVGQFPPNAFQLYDMHGNVSEWVEDPWHANYRGSPPSDGMAWMEGADNGRRMFRGGSWNGTPQLLRSANRGWNIPNVWLNALGFRVARTLVTP